MSEVEKNRSLSEFTCYELHFFIKKKDPDYFEKVVRGFIATKMEKNFMDYYLIDETDSVLEYASLTHNKKLNYFELCLLIDTAVRSGKPEMVEFAK